jgi:hypothetical protein
MECSRSAKFVEDMESGLLASTYPRSICIQACLLPLTRSIRKPARAQGLLASSYPRSIRIPPTTGLSMTLFIPIGRRQMIGRSRITRGKRRQTLFLPVVLIEEQGVSHVSKTVFGVRATLTDFRQSIGLLCACSALSDYISC